jgi:hypothetical protein
VRPGTSGHRRTTPPSPPGWADGRPGTRHSHSGACRVA